MTRGRFSYLALTLTHCSGIGQYGEDLNSKHPKAIGLSGCIWLVVVLVRQGQRQSGFVKKPNTLTLVNVALLLLLEQQRTCETLSLKVSLEL
jgi:hypothetical protein